METYNPVGAISGLRQLAPLKNICIGETEYVLSPLSRGGFAELYIGATERGRRRNIVVKVPHASSIATAGGLRRWQRECLILTRLRHESLPRPIAIENSPKPLLAYALVPGQTLAQSLHLRTPTARRIDIGNLLHVAAGLLNSLCYLHGLSRPIAHGDISPNNIVLTAENELRLIDFGCAIQVGRQKFSPWVAAPRYLSPEQARGQVWAERSDLYQAGLILYELITGKPYNATANVRTAILQACAPRGFPTHMLRRAIGASLAHWLSDLLEPDYGSRLPSAKCAAKLLTALDPR